MSNEILLILELVVIYSILLAWFYFFDQKGMLCFTVFATICANIEVMLVINAFSIEQTLGNAMFGASFLATDMLSEFYGKKKSRQAVFAGLLTTISFVVCSKIWLMYDLAYDDGLKDSFSLIFSNTTRIMIASIIVYAISQMLDVFVYHKWWEFTEKLTGDKRKLLWVRNNGSTLISQLVNSFLFAVFAFYGVLPNEVVWSIFISSYIVFIVVSLLDTPFIYLARHIHETKHKSS